MARTRDASRAFAKLVTVDEGALRIKAVPPLIVPLSDLPPPGRVREENEAEMQALLRSHRGTVRGDDHPIEEFELVQTAKRVGGGSVGMRTWVLLLRGRDDDDPLCRATSPCASCTTGRETPTATA